jgi:hypothetical protein
MIEFALQVGFSKCSTRHTTCVASNRATTTPNEGIGAPCGQTSQIGYVSYITHRPITGCC